MFTDDVSFCMFFCCVKQEDQEHQDRRDFQARELPDRGVFPELPADREQQDSQVNCFLSVN